MGNTIAEKILSEHNDRPARAGDFVLANVDVSMGNDGSLPLVFEASRKMKDFHVTNAENTVLVLDHYCPSPSREVAMLQEEIRQFADEHGCLLYDWGEGICHRLLMERGHVRPGMLVAGADSHTVTYGALNSFATGIGSTDLAVVMKYGMLWFRVPHTIRLEVNGRPEWPVGPKDVALHIIGSFGASGANYQALEVYGATISEMKMDGRFTFCNAMVEMGAKVAILPFDAKTDQWLTERGAAGPFQPVEADSDAVYVRTESFDVSHIEPQIAVPHQVDNVHSISEVEGTPIRLALLGTCSNGHIEDLLDAARILKGKRIHPKVRLVVSPGSRQVLEESLQNGSYETLVESGAVFNSPGCGNCVGAHGGIPVDDTNVLSTANRNFLGRMGNRNASIYLGSPATMAASALTGEITDPRRL